MTEKQKSTIGWISVALILFGMAASAIAFTVTTNNKADNNKESIVKIENKVDNNEARINFHDTKISHIDEMRSDIKELKAQNTEILVSLGRIEEKLEKEK